MESVVVARARIAHEVHLDVEAPEELRAAAGDEVAVKFCYEYREVRHDRDPFRLTLRAWAPTELESARREHEDHFLRPDDEDGFIVVRLRMPRHDTDLHWEVHVRRTTEAWAAAEQEKVESDASAHGTVRLRAA